MPSLFFHPNHPTLSHSQPSQALPIPPPTLSYTPHPVLFTLPTLFSSDPYTQHSIFTLTFPSAPLIITLTIARSLITTWR